MGAHIELTASDRFTFNAYQSLPEGKCVGGVVIIQEIFGVNAHIREVVDGYAERGFAAIAPSVFDRIEVGVELEYNQDGIEKGLDLARQQLPVEDAIKDISACIEHLSTHGKVATIGYCFGGYLSYLAACKIDALDCAVSYYGGGITKVLDQKPVKPILFHFAEHDPTIPLDDVELVKQTFPDAPCYLYPAEHGFNCDHRSAWNSESATLALQRTTDFLSLHLA